jgi:hypothetical protein
MARCLAVNRYGHNRSMGIGVSVFLIALGAILYFATNFDVAGLDVNTVGVILMIVGVVGLVVSLLIFGPRRRSTTVIDDDPRI